MRVLVIGAKGVGKSTVLNALNSQALKSDRKEFVVSNKLTGCTKNFEYEMSPFPFVGLVQLIDSPGLADPDLLFD
jgi:putative ribosome biogenesis GTPase RsgA